MPYHVKKGLIMPKVSIIMPSLNVRKYIRPCIESVLGQTLSDMEILAIDAGSDDGTAEILEEYAHRDSRLRVFHSDKKSYGYQVNLGLGQAAGEWIGIVETDDIVAPEMYETLYRTALAEGLDYVKCGFSCFVETDSGLRWHQSGGMCVSDMSLLGKRISPKNMPELAIQDYYLWAGLYRREFLRDIRLSETPGAAFQDIGFIFQTLSKADRAVYLHDELYFYRQTKGNSSFNRNGFRYLIREYENERQLFASFSAQWRQAYYARMFRQTVGRLQRMAVGGTYWEDAKGDLEMLLGAMRQAELDGDFKPDGLSEENREVYKKLQQNPREIFAEEDAVLKPKAQKMRAALAAVGGRGAVIFGCGVYGKYLHVLLEMHRPGQVCAFCDNNSLLWNTAVQGLAVLQPAEAVGKYPDAVYMTANVRSGEAIRGQLLELGIEEEQICRYQPDIDIRLFLI